MAKRKDYLGRSLAASLFLHVALLSLQFGVPGMGMPWPGFALNERKASIPTIKAVLRSGKERAVIAQPVIPMAPPAKILPPVPKKLKHREPRIKKLAAGKKHPKPAPAVQPKPPPVQVAPTPVPVVPVPITASMEKVKESAVPQIEREEIVKPVVKVEKQKTQSDEIAVLSTEKESSWQLNTVSPNTVTSDVQAEAQKEQIAREAKIREQQLAEEQEEQRQKAQAQALAAKKAEGERAIKEEAAAALEKAQVEAQKNEERAAMEKTQAAAEDKIRQEQIALAKERDEAERTAKAAALAREEESRRKEEQAALAKAKEEVRRKAEQAALVKAQEDAKEKKKAEAEALAAEEKRKEEQAALAKAKEDALAKAIQAEARAREQAAAASAANAAAEMIRAAERGARNSANAVDGKAEGNKQGGGAPAKGVDLARRAIDMARSGLSGLPVKAPIETDRPRRGSILGRNPSDIQLAFYGESWTQKIERIASVNYPKLNRNIFYGSLVLSVSINSDGSVAARRIVRSSGNKELDEAVLRIVDMCSPFAAFPPDLKRNYDVVEVTRTLSFPEKPPLIISQ